MKSVANAQTKASKKYQDKVGLVAKTYKLKKTLVDEFAEKCKESGIATSKQISIMMQEYIDDN